MPTPHLTPYDTGARLKPTIWPVLNDPDANGPYSRYGKVDFDNDESATVLTVYVTPDNNGGHVVHVIAHDESPVSLDLEG